MQCRKTLYLWFVCFSQFVKFLHFSKNLTIQFGQFLYFIGKKTQQHLYQNQRGPEVSSEGLFKCLANNLKMADEAAFPRRNRPIYKRKNIQMCAAKARAAVNTHM